ncbi:MAG: hypothetical protein AB1331_03420 [Bacillota bacterium]
MADQQARSAPDQPVTTYRLIRFFAPLAATSMMMMSSHSLISGGLTRTSQPEVSIAAYALATSIWFIVDSPMVNVRQMILALAWGPRSFRAVAMVTNGLVIISLAIGLLLSYTPVGPWVLRTLLGAPENLVAPAVSALRVLMFLSIVSSRRSLYQSLLMLKDRTGIFPLTMVIRLGLMVLFVAASLRYDLVRGAALGGATLLLGVGTEGLLAQVYGKRVVRDQPLRAGGAADNVSLWQAMVFFFPLIGAALVGGFLRPALNSGMARSFDATVALSAFAVATSLSWMVISPTQNLHQLTMIWLPRPGGRARVFRFVLVFSLVFTLVIAVLGFTPVGPWLLLGPIGLERSLLAPTILVVRIQALIPLVLSWSEYFSGILLINRQTSAITVGKLVNLAVVLAGVALFHGARLPSGTALGALLQVLGIAGEVLFLYAVVRRAGQ